MRGMFVELQEKSIQQDIVDFISNNDVDGLFSFVTDDVPPDILKNKGHLDFVIKKSSLFRTSSRKGNYCILVCTCKTHWT